MQSSTMWYEE